MAKTTARSKLLLAAIALLIVPLLLGAAEILVRLFAPRLDPLAVFVSSPQLRSDTQGPTTTGLFEFDPALTWRLKPGLDGVWWDYTSVRTNAAHLRMDREIGPKTGIRIVCLGDSVTFGYRVPLAHDRAKPEDYDRSEQAYPALLEGLLRARFPGQSIEVLPLACPGYTSGQGLAWLNREIAELQPDLVTACFGWNDVRAAGFPDRATFPAHGGQIQIRAIMARSQLLLRVAQSAQAARARDLTVATNEPRASVAEYLEHFAQMAATASKHRAWFGIISPVYRDSNAPGDYPEGRAHPDDQEEASRIGEYRRALQASAQTARTPHLLIPELTETAWPGNADLFGERIHPNAAGHRLMAERVADFVSPAMPEAKFPN